MTSRGEIAFPQEQQMQSFAQQLAARLHPPMVIWLQGDLGTGKTAFTRALVHALGYQGVVKSPTYGLMEHYPLPSLKVLHLDLYRISDPDELEFLGLADLLDDETILLVEWPDKGGHWLAQPDFIFEFTYADQGRVLRWSASTAAARMLNLQSINS